MPKSSEIQPSGYCVSKAHLRDSAPIDDSPLGKLPESIHDYAFAYDSEKEVAEFLAKEKL